MNQTNKKKQMDKGITLIALIITIVVLLILAVVTIYGVKDGGIIRHAKNAQQQTEIAKIKERIMTELLSLSSMSADGELNKEKIQEKLNQSFGEGNVEVFEAAGGFEVYFKELGMYFTVDKNGNVKEHVKVTEIANAGDITKGGTLDGSSEKPYQISCIEDLLALSYDTNYI